MCELMLHHSEIFSGVAKIEVHLGTTIMVLPCQAHQSFAYINCGNEKLFVISNHTAKTGNSIQICRSYRPAVSDAMYDLNCNFERKHFTFLHPQSWQYVK